MNAMFGIKFEVTRVLSVVPEILYMQTVKIKPFGTLPQGSTIEEPWFPWGFVSQMLIFLLLKERMIMRKIKVSVGDGVFLSLKFYENMYGSNCLPVKADAVGEEEYLLCSMMDFNLYVECRCCLHV